VLILYYIGKFLTVVHCIGSKWPFCCLFVFRIWKKSRIQGKRPLLFFVWKGDEFVSPLTWLEWMNVLSTLLWLMVEWMARYSQFICEKHWCFLSHIWNNTRITLHWIWI